MLEDVKFWKGFANEFGYKTIGDEYGAKSLGKMINTVNNNGRVSISQNNSHTVVLKSLSVKRIYRPSKTIIKFTYKAMSNGSVIRVNSSNFINIFFLTPLP